MRASSQRQGCIHKSAGCTRAAPVKASTSRCWGNRPTDATVFPASSESRNSLKAKLARSILATASSEHCSGFCTKAATAFSIAWSMALAGLMPTISRAPAAWWSCWRAKRKGATSRVATSSPRAISASRVKRRRDFTAPSSDLRISSMTQASGPRSLSPPSERMSWAVSSVCMLDSPTNTFNRS